MKTVRPCAVLFYYDGIQLFEARDSFGGNYLGLLVEPDGLRERFLVAGVEPSRLWGFKAGTLDLRTLLLDREDTSYYIALPTTSFSEPIQLVEQVGSIEDSGWLPDPGFLLHNTPSESNALSEARGRYNLVIELTMNPPESANGHRIHAETLGRMLSTLQPLLKHAYGWAFRELPAALQRKIERSTAPLVDVVVPATAGSFRILLEAAEGPGLFGQSELARAMRTLDYLLERVGDPQETLARVQRHKGHLAGAYLRLMKFLVSAQSGFQYTWAEPRDEEPQTRSISSVEAMPIVAALEAVSDLSVETIHLVGALRKADVDRGTWRIETEDREAAGETKPGGPSLAGLRIDGRYHFTCEETLEETGGTGRERRTLYLLDHEPA